MKGPFLEVEKKVLASECVVRFPREFTKSLQNTKEKLSKRPIFSPFLFFLLGSFEPFVYPLED